MSALKVWNGTSWVASADFGRLKVWDGTDWTFVIPKVWTPSTSSTSLTLNVGYRNDDVYIPMGGSWTDRTWGYDSNIGSVTPKNSALYSAWDGLTVDGLFYNYTSLSDSNIVQLTIAGAPNSGWTTMTTSTGYSYSRSSATYSAGIWQWSGSGYTNNPFSTIGSNVTITWS